jgi:hypothetical protein
LRRGEEGGRGVTPSSHIDTAKGGEDPPCGRWVSTVFRLFRKCAKKKKKNNLIAVSND